MEFISDSSDSTHPHKTQEEAKQDSVSFILSPRKAQLSNSRRLCIKSISLSSFFQFEVLNWDFSEIDSSFNLTCEITDLHRCLSFIVWKPFSLKGSRVSYSKIWHIETLISVLGKYLTNWGSRRNSCSQIERLLVSEIGIWLAMNTYRSVNVSASHYFQCFPQYLSS